MCEGEEQEEPGAEERRGDWTAPAWSPAWGHKEDIQLCAQVTTDPNLHCDADSDPNFCFDADSDPNFYFDADLDPNFFFNADSDPDGHQNDADQQANPTPSFTWRNFFTEIPVYGVFPFLSVA
jgi:hypothetical protein